MKLLFVCLLILPFIVVLLFHILIRSKDCFMPIKLVPTNWLHNIVDTVYVISLRKRREYITNVMSLMKIKPIYFEAIYKKNIDRDQLIKENKILKDCQLNNGRIACHLSHIAVLKDFLKHENQKTCFIFEDDIKLIDYSLLFKSTESIQDIIKNAPSDWDVINFGRCYDDCNTQTTINKNLGSSSPLCRHAYAITRKGAQIIIDKTIPMTDKGDVMVKNLIVNKQLICYSAIPRIFNQNRKEIQTELGNKDKMLECILEE